MSWFPLMAAYCALTSYYVNCLRELESEANEKHEKGETSPLTVVEQKKERQSEE